MSASSPTRETCDHFYITRLSPSGLSVSVRACQACGEVDWVDLIGQFKERQPKSSPVAKVIGGIFAIVLASLTVGVLAILVGLVVAGLRAVW